MATNEYKMYNVWKAMKRRCNNSNTWNYKNYGGRGIRVCKEWQSWQNFKHDMALTYKVGLTLDRINNDGNYSKMNCRWVTREVQANNTRRSRFINFKGEVKTLTQWIKYLKLKPSTVRQRYYVYKWDIDKCFKGGLQIG